MFKKRTINKESNNLLNSQTFDNNGLNIQKKVIKSGIDLRKDIQQMQEIISHKKQKQPTSHHFDHPNNNDEQKHQYSTFKTKKINKFTSHILKNLPTRTLEKQPSISSNLHQNQLSINTNIKFQHPLAQSAHNEALHKELVQPNLNNYGLLDKHHFKSTQNNNCQVIESSKGKNHQQTLMDYYIKKRMEQMTKNANPPTNSSFNSNSHQASKQSEAWQEVLQIQKQYLTQQEKIKQYSMQQIQKKLQKLAQQTIKSQIQKRNSYLKDLLQNEYERMQYASKKQLKIMKQDKQRIQRQLNSKYRDSGRRNFIENIKNQIL